MLASSPRRSNSLAALATIALAACAVTPERQYPEFRDHHLSARYIAPDDGRIRMPATTRDLVVHELELRPAPHAESFDADGTRWVFYDTGTEVALRGRFRAYGNGELARTPRQLLPGADLIEVLESQQ